MPLAEPMRVASARPRATRMFGIAFMCVSCLQYTEQTVLLQVLLVGASHRLVFVKIEKTSFGYAAPGGVIANHAIRTHDSRCQDDCVRSP